MSKIFYKGYQIKPTPLQSSESGEWTIDLYIGIEKGNQYVERKFSAANTFKTKEEEIGHCINFGKQIIDGEYANCTVTDL